MKSKLTMIFGTLLVAIVFLTSFFPGRWGYFLQIASRKRFTAPQPRPARGHYLFRLSEQLTLDYPSTIGDLEFARLVKKRSHGRIQIIIYPNGQLGDERSSIEQIQFGGIDFARVNAAPLADVYHPLIVLSLPYIFRDSHHLWDVLYSPIGDRLLQGLDSQNLVGLTYYSSAARSFYFTSPVHSLEDLRGLRIRVLQSGYYMDFIRALGATPVMIPFSDVARAFTAGEIDGAENNWSSYYAEHHYRLAKYYLEDLHTRTPEVLLASRSVFAQLKPEDRALIRQAARDSVAKEWAASFASEARLQSLAPCDHVTVIRLSTRERARFRQAVAVLYQTYGKAYLNLIQQILEVK